MNQPRGERGTNDIKGGFRTGPAKVHLAGDSQRIVEQRPSCPELERTLSKCDRQGTKRRCR